MAKKIPCWIRLHGATKEIHTSEFPSIKAAKTWVSECWHRPYTIVKGSPPKKDLEVSKTYISLHS